MLEYNEVSILPEWGYVSLVNTDVLCTNRQNVLGLAPCTHEEAATRILPHLEDAGTTKSQHA